MQSNIQTTPEEIQKAVDENYRALAVNLSEIESQHNGKYVLLRHKEVVEAFDSITDAMIYGDAQFSDSLFSIQFVPDRIADLGYYGYALPLENL